MQQQANVMFDVGLIQLREWLRSGRVKDGADDWVPKVGDVVVVGSVIRSGFPSHVWVRATMFEGQHEFDYLVEEFKRRGYEIWHVVDDAELTKKLTSKRATVISRGVAWNICMELLQDDQALRDMGVRVTDRIKITDMMQGGYHRLDFWDKDSHELLHTYRIPYDEDVFLNDFVNLAENDPFGWEFYTLSDCKYSPDGTIRVSALIRDNVPKGSIFDMFIPF